MWKQTLSKYLWMKPVEQSVRKNGFKNLLRYFNNPEGIKKALTKGVPCCYGFRDNARRGGNFAKVHIVSSFHIQRQHRHLGIDILRMALFGVYGTV